MANTEINNYVNTGAPKKPKTNEDVRISEIGKSHLDSRPYESQTTVDTKLTLDDLGLYMSERMLNSITKRGGNDNLVQSASLPYHSNQKNIIVNYNNNIGSNVANFYRDGSLDPSNSSTIAYKLSEPIKLDLSMGKAEVLNVPFQFNELDDIRSNLDYLYIGRLYLDRIYNYNLPKVLFTVGQLNTKMRALSMVGFYNRTNDLNNYLRSGGKDGIAWTMSRIKLGFSAAASYITKGFLKSKSFYSFEPVNKIYMRYVNEILLELSTYMDLAQPAIENVNYVDSDDRVNPNFNEKDPDSQEYDNSFSNIIDKPNNNFDGGSPELYDGIPSAKTYMGKRLLHIYNILPGMSNDDGDNASKQQKKNIGETIVDSATDFLGQMIQYNTPYFVPFMLQKGVSVSESFSNTTQEHPVLGQLNGISLKSQQDEMGQHMDLNMAGDVAAKLMQGDLGASLSGYATTAFRRIAAGAAGHGGGEMGVILSGQGRFQFPEVWSDSNFDRSYNLTFKLFTPYGDRLSVFENIYVPFIMLLAMALPKQIGTASYITPFFIKAFAKGLFSCELGIITSLTVSRGEEINDRTFEGFPRSMTVNVNIKDLTPKLSLSLDGGVFGIISAKNVGFKEYLYNLANLDFKDRVALTSKLANAGEFLKTKFSPERLGMDFRTNLSNNFIFGLTTFIGNKVFGTVSNTVKSRPISEIY